jgi:thymidylate synthase
MMNVKAIRFEFADQTPDEKGMLEIPFAQFLADEPTIFGRPNEDWHARELAWYLSMSRSIHDIPPPIPSIWKQVASSSGLINSNYGWCVFSEENGLQYQRCLEALCKDPYTRQAIMIYTRPSMHADWQLDGNGYDFICTNTVQVLIREGQLHYAVYMRSSDAVFGYKGDRAWHTYVFDRLIEDLATAGINVVKGDMIWNAASLHIYPRHHDLVSNFWETGGAY